MAQLMADLMKIQMLSRDIPLRKFFLFQSFEMFLQYIPNLIPRGIHYCSRHKPMLQMEDTKQATITCERVFQSTTNNLEVAYKFML